MKENKRKALVAKLGKRVADLRRQQGLTQQELAARFKTPKIVDSVMGKLEQGRAIPSVERLAEIAEALGVDLAELFVFDEPRADEWRSLHRRVMSMIRQRPIEDVEAALDVLSAFLRRRARERR